MIVFLQKKSLHYFNIYSKEILNVSNASNYFMLGYCLVSIINQAYNLYIDNIYEQKLAEVAKKKERREKRREKREKMFGL